MSVLSLWFYYSGVSSSLCIASLATATIMEVNVYPFNFECSLSSLIPNVLPERCYNYVQVLVKESLIIEFEQ